MAFFRQSESEVIEMKNRILSGLLGVVVPLIFVSGVMAQEKVATAMAAPAQQMKLEKFNGVVEHVDMTKKDVVVQYHKDKMTFSVSDKTKLFEGNKELNLSELNKGLWASVEYQKEGNQLFAKSIHVSPLRHAKNMVSSGTMPEKKMMTSEKSTEQK
jgi:Cu/Ag efflux protein CusF